MTRLLFSLFLVFSLVHVSAKEIVIERPPFSVRNHGTLEIEKIVLNDESTVIHFTAYQMPGWWFRIDTGTYIVANGKKYLVESAEGLKLDEETYPDESGKRPFILTFPAIDPATERIDFIESDCENCFKTWGIELKSDVLTNRISIPAEIKKLAEIRVNEPLKPYGFKMGNAHIKGRLLGYQPEMKLKGTIYINNPVTGNQEENNFDIAADGSFDTQIAVVTSMQVLMRLSDLFIGTVLVSPQEETSIYIDLQQKGCQESRTRKDKCPAGKWIYFGGAFADVNNTYYDADLFNFIGNYFMYRDMQNEMEGMTALEYKNYILDKGKAAQKALLEKDLSVRVRQIVERSIHNISIYYLTMGEFFLESAYRAKNNIEYRTPIPGYKKPVFTVEYYQFLNDMDLDNPLNLYASDYSGTVSSCRYLSLNRRGVFVHSLPDAAQYLIDMVDMTPDELAYAKHLVSQKYENWSSEKVREGKQALKEQLDKLMQSDKVTDKTEEDAARIDSLISDENTNYRLLYGQFLEFGMAHPELGQESPDAPAVCGVGTEEDTLFSPEFRQAFSEKYKEYTDQFFSDAFAKTSIDLLAKILGTDRGLLFDLMLTQRYASSLEEMVPVSSLRMAKIKELDNPFYYTYLSAKNDEVLAKIEENKKKGGYNVFATPEVEEDALLSEILKPFQGKVILIDFWNTWCGPCRMAMKDFEPAKQIYKDKDVVFVYLADESSPVKAWENMIPDIPGEHYRLKNDQMKFLKDKFGVTGIPSYLILNKKGEQVYFRVAFPGSHAITEILDRELGVE